MASASYPDGLKRVNFSSLSFVVCVNLFQHILNHPSSFICISLEFFYLNKLLFSDFLQFKGNVVIELLVHVNILQSTAV